MSEKKKRRSSTEKRSSYDNVSELGTNKPNTASRAHAANSSSTTVTSTTTSSNNNNKSVQQHQQAHHHHVGNSQQPLYSGNGNKNDNGQTRTNGNGKHNNNNNNGKKTMLARTVSHDRVRKIVQEEGRSARNLIAYSVPVTDSEQKQSIGLPKAPKSPRKRSVTHVGREMSPSTTKRADDNMSIKSSSSRPPSSAGSHMRKTDMRARYWAFLFDNLKRAVDEIYQTCEADESVYECKEVILMLQQCTKDFTSLITQWNVVKAYEDMEESGQKPHSLTWEVRKTSPGKLHLPADRSTPSPATLFSPSSLPGPSEINGGGSWADLVKGTLTLSELERQFIEADGAGTSSPLPPTKQPPSDMLRPEAIKPNDSDIGDVNGWETVRRSRSRTSPANKTSPGSSHGNGKFSKPTNKTPPGEPVKARNINKNSTTEYVGVRNSRSADVPKNQSTCKPVSQHVSSARTVNRAKYIPKENLKMSSQLKEDPVKPPTPRRLELGDIPASDSTVNEPCENAPANELTDEELKLLVESDDDEQEVLALQLEALEGVFQDEAQDAALEDAIQEERSYLEEIEQTKNAELPAELESADDAELGNTATSLDSLGASAGVTDWESMVSKLDVETERRKLLGISWADIDEAESRTPGRGATLHEKLSSPSRKISIDEAKKKHEEKQAKAAELRERFIQEKAEKLRHLVNKVEDVRSWKDELLDRQRNSMQRKLLEAEAKRANQLKLKVKKAHEEETKVNEISFINTLSEQNKKMDILTKHQDVEARLQDRQEERQRKIDEKAAKEAAVEERRKVLEIERMTKLVDMQQKRKKREEEIEQKNFEKEKWRSEAAKMKEKEHRDRMAVIEKQQQEHIVELQKKIETKQNESSRRHEERLQSIREKAFIMNIVKHSTEDHNEAPKLGPYDTKKVCTVCNIYIPSEVHLLSHLRGKRHQKTLKDMQSVNGDSMSRKDIETFNIEHIHDVPGDYEDPKAESNKERTKSLKKKCKKLRQRMQSRGNEYEAGLSLRQETSDSQHKAKLGKLAKDVTKFMEVQEKGPWPQNKISALDRSLGEVARILDKKAMKDQVTFRICGGLNVMCRMLPLLQEETIINMYPKTFSSVCNIIRLACKSCFENCHYMLFSNRIGTLIDLLIARLLVMNAESDQSNQLDLLGSTIDSTTLTTFIHGPVDNSHITIDPCAVGLIYALATILSCLGSCNPQVKASEKSAGRLATGTDAFTNRINDAISYSITVGVVDKLQSLYNSVRGSLDKDLELSQFLQHSISFLTSMTKLITKRSSNVFESQVSDPTPLMQTLEGTEIVGVMSLLYGMLLHNAPCRGEAPSPPELSPNTLTVTLAGLRLINQVATMDYKLLQRVLGAEGISLELRHIVSYLIWYCNHHCDNDELLHEVILCVGYFSVLNPDNQTVIQSGQPPNILQQLCDLPFHYFSDPKLVTILFPSLIASCFESADNKKILEQEVSCELLANFIEEQSLEAQQLKLMPSRKIAGSSSPGEGRMSLVMRFPKAQWTEAKDFFKS